MTDKTPEFRPGQAAAQTLIAPAELKRLYDERKELNARIRAAKSKARVKDRTLRNRRGILTGLAMLEWLDTHSDNALAEQVQRTRDWWLKKPEERALFGLPPLPETTAASRSSVPASSPPALPQLVVENAESEAA